MSEVNEHLHAVTFRAVENAILESCQGAPDSDIKEAFEHLMFNLNFKARSCGVDTTDVLRSRMLLLAMLPEGASQVAVGRAKVISAMATAESCPGE